MEGTRKIRFMVDLRRLRALRAVADHGTLAAAADALHLTPSAVSQQLAALERELGHALLEPSGRSVRLTPAAHVLLGHADALFAQLEKLEGDLAAQDAAPRGEVRIGGFPTALAGLLAPAARPLHAVAPAVTLRIQEAETPEAVGMLVARDVDLILGMECSAAPRRDDTRFHREELLGDILDAVLPSDHPLAGRARIDLADLSGEGWVAPPVGWSCDEVFVAGCRGAGFSPEGRAPRGRLAGRDGARRGRPGDLARPTARSHRAARGRRDRPADGRPAQAPRVRGLPRRGGVLARDPCRARRARRFRPRPDAVDPRRMMATTRPCELALG